MIKKILLMLSFLTMLSCGVKEDKVIKIAAATFPMENIVRIAATNLEKEGYKVEVSVLTDYVTANVGLKAKDFDANFHQHEPFMNVFNAKNKGNLVKVASIYDVYMGFYSEKYKDIQSLPKDLKIAIPNDPTNMDRSLRILADYNFITIPQTDKLVKLEDVVMKDKNIQFLPVAIPNLVQAFKESDLTFNWPSHMKKIGYSAQDIVIAEKNADNKFAIILASREDNKDSKKIQDLKKAMQSPEVKKFLEDNYKDQGYALF